MSSHSTNGHIYFLLDSDEEFGKRRSLSTKRRKCVHKLESNEAPSSLSDSEGTDVSDLGISDQEEDADEDVPDTTNYDSDHGVFDVNETGSSDELHTPRYPDPTEDTPEDRRAD